jgi:hypothetical protein
MTPQQHATYRLLNCQRTICVSTLQVSGSYMVAYWCTLAAAAATAAAAAGGGGEQA